MPIKYSRASAMEVMHIVDDEVELMKKRISSRIKRYLKDGSERNMKLKFTNKIPDIILTSEEIKAQGGAHLEVALVDDPSEKVVDVGPEASARLEVVLLKNDDDGEEKFEQNIVPETRGKKPLLDGNVGIRLQGGVGVVHNVKLRNHAIQIKPAVFKLGVRAVDGFCIKEAKTESFTVKDYRKKYHAKRQNPSLSDEVSRLCNIAKGGKIYKRLQRNEIKTVEDFLIRLLINCDELKNIVKMGPKKWEKTVKNARACSSETRMYCYMNPEQRKGVAFNVLGQAIGLFVEGRYSPMLTEEQHKAYAEELLASAYKNWGDVKPFDDLNSLEQHLITCLSTNCPQDCPEAAEMIGESSGRRSFHRVSSAMGGEDFSSNDVEAPMILPHDIEDWYQGFDDYYEQLINKSNGDGSALEVVPSRSSDSPKRWKNLLARFFSFKKRESAVADVAPHHKKQKIG